MALLVREDGTEETYELPVDGTELSRLLVVQRLLGGYVEVGLLADNRVMLVNEDGLSLELRDNPKASAMAGRRLVGPVLVCTKEEVAAWDAQ